MRTNETKVAHPMQMLSWDEVIAQCGIPMGYGAQTAMCISVVKAFLGQYRGETRAKHAGDAITAMGDGMAGDGNGGNVANPHAHGTINWWAFRAGSCAKHLPKTKNLKNAFAFSK